MWVIYRTMVQCFPAGTTICGPSGWMDFLQNRLNETMMLLIQLGSIYAISRRKMFNCIVKALYIGLCHCSYRVTLRKTHSKILMLVEFYWRCWIEKLDSSVLDRLSSYQNCPKHFSSSRPVERLRFPGNVDFF